MSCRTQAPGVSRSSPLPQELAPALNLPRQREGSAGHAVAQEGSTRKGYIWICFRRQPVQLKYIQEVVVLPMSVSTDCNFLCLEQRNGSRTEGWKNSRGKRGHAQKHTCPTVIGAGTAIWASHLPFPKVQPGAALLKTHHGRGAAGSRSHVKLANSTLESGPGS